MSGVQLRVKGAVVRPFKRGDETQIVNLLNLCFGEWGTTRKWHKQYLQYPSFEKNDVFIIEKNDEIIGYEGLLFRDLIMQKDCEVRTVSLRDAAVHPRYRRRGLHARLLELMLQAAKSRGAGLVFSWYLRGSSLHAHSKDIGFVEVKQPAAYMKVMKPEKVLRSGLLDLLHKSQSLSKALQDLDSELVFRLGKFEFSVTELLSESSKERGGQAKKPVKDKDKVEIILDDDSLVTLAKFRNMNKRQRLKTLISLILLRKAKICFSSFKALLNLVQKGLVVVGSI